MQTPTEHKTLKYNSYKIHYYISGNENYETIICLHPAFADHNCFNGQLSDLSEKYKVITIDMIGHGLSQPNKTKDKIDKTTEHIKQIMATENIETTHLLGVSLGSLLAQYFAVSYPSLIKSVIVLGGYNINIQDPEINRAQRNEGFKWMLRILYSMTAFRKYASIQSVKNADSRKTFYEMMQGFRRKSFPYMSGMSRIIQNRHDIEIPYPINIIIGDGDIKLAQRKAKEFHKRETSSKYYVIKNAGHCANMDNPIEFNKILMNLLKE